MTMIRKMVDSDIDSVMDIWFQSTVDAHPFIDLHYWEKVMKL